MDNYRCYLTARVRIFNAFGQDSAGEESFTFRVHRSVSAMETQMAAYLVTVSLMMMLPSSVKPVLVLSFDFWFDRFRTFTCRNLENRLFSPMFCLKCVLLIRQGRDQVHGLCWWGNTNKTKNFLICIMQKEICMYGIFIFLCHHSKYSYGLLHTIDLFTWGFKL